jgi:hypothetical protein
MYYDNIRNNPARCNKVVPLTQLDADLASGNVPQLAWITPNVCDDMHDCSIAAGDTWLRTWVPKILNSRAWKQNGPDGGAGSVLFITFDEGVSSAGCCAVTESGEDTSNGQGTAVSQAAAGGRVFTVVVSPLVQPGFVSQVAYDHFSLLRTIEDAWGLPHLLNAGSSASAAMTDFFASKK